MNDLDNEIRRAFDELVNAAPPPPSAPSPVVPFRTGRDPRQTRLLAIAASILLVAAVGMITLAQRDGRSDTLSTSAGSGGPVTTEVTTTSPPVPTEPPLVRVETGGSPDPVTSVELAPVDEYDVVTSPPLPGTTEPVPVQGEAYDGVYFAYLHEGPGPDDPRALRFDVVQAFSGQDCVERFGDDAPSVCTPFGIDMNGSVGQLDLSVDGIVVTVRDVNSDDSYRISGTELVSIVNGEPAAASVPEGYAFSGGFGFLLTFDNGTLARIDQPGDPRASTDVSGWAAATEPFPDLAYIACCGTDWSGQPSPAVPTDPADQLVPGIYNIRQVVPDDPLDGILSLEVRAYARCNDLGDRGSCSAGEPYADDALGVADQPDRVIDLALDTVEVAVSSTKCGSGELVAENQIGRGRDLAALYSELDDSYRTAVIDPLDAGVGPTDIRASLTAGSPPGFFDPGCPSWSDLWWSPVTGPTVITPFVAMIDGLVDWRAVNIWQTIIPTALLVDEQGDTTLYVTTGFLS
jgi:hypothetical protein